MRVYFFVPIALGKAQLGQRCRVYRVCSCPYRLSSMSDHTTMSLVFTRLVVGRGGEDRVEEEGGEDRVSDGVGNG